MILLREQPLELVDSLYEECAQPPFAMNDFQHLVSYTSTIISNEQFSLLIGLGKATQNAHDTFARCIKVQLAQELHFFSGLEI